MECFGEIVRKLRKAQGETLETVASSLGIDTAIVSKIERGERKASQQHMEKLSGYFKDHKDDLRRAWLTDRILYTVGNDPMAEEALKAAEEQVQYLETPTLSEDTIKTTVAEELDKFEAVKKAWIFGSFARNEVNLKSDIDLMIDVPAKQGFSLFDVFEIQHNLENKLGRKVDIVMKDALKDFAGKTAKKDLKLIYDRS